MIRKAHGYDDISLRMIKMRQMFSKSLNYLISELS